jgi:hypothetical protein
MDHNITISNGDQINLRNRLSIYLLIATVLKSISGGNSAVIGHTVYLEKQELIIFINLVI